MSNQMKLDRRNERCKKLVFLGAAAAAAWLLVPLFFFFAVPRTDGLPQVTRLSEISITQVSDLFDSIRSYGRLPLSKNNGGVASDQVQHLGATKEKAQVSDETTIHVSSSDVAAAPRRSQLSCNLSSFRMDTCAMEGDVRMHGRSATVYVVAASDDSYRPENGTVTIHPYARKWEPRTMQRVREVTIRPVAADDTAPPPPRCSATHHVPAVVFSTTSAYSENFFHAIDDTIIPLYNTAREYDGHVQLVATDYNAKWMSQYRHILATLSVYPVIDFDADDAVRCFPSVHVGVESHDELRINPALSRKGYTMMDFREFLRSAYSLKEHTESGSAPAPAGQRRPRLVMVLRRRSRAITNEAEAIATVREAGFEVVVAGPEMVRDLARMAEVVSSCDVMLGVHGAGLTNMVFLPGNATVVQICPWGNMKEICWHEFSRPLPDMGLRYAEYEATAEETTFKDVYPKDHAVFTDPASIHAQGFIRLWEFFLNGQNVTLDIQRFRGAMQQVYQSVTIN